MRSHPIPYGRQYIDDDDIEEVVRVLKSDALTQGPKVKEFEYLFSKYVGAKYAVAVSNGTAALHLSAIALGIKLGDKVITTPITFIATANSIRYCGGEVVFCDIDPVTYTLDINKVADLLKKSPKGTYKGIIPVDYAGYPVNMEEFRKLADDYGLWIIEDACHAPGGYFTDSKNKIQFCGNGNFVDLSIFSFHPVKHIAAGEGGMITTNNKDLYDHLLNLRTHGIQQNYDLLTENHGLWYYEMQELGFNYRLSDIHCALALSQLKKADKNLEIRKNIARRYDVAFINYPSKILTPKYNEGHAFHLYVAQFSNRDELQKHLRYQHNIFAQVHYIPVYLHPYYKQFGWKYGDFPVTEDFYKKCLTIPLYPTLTDEEQSYVINSIQDFYK